MPGRIALLALPVSFALGSLAPAFAADPQASGTPDPQAKACKYVQYVGSRIPKRECRTNAEWAELQKAQDAERDDARRSRSGTCGEGAGGAC